MKLKKKGSLLKYLEDTEDVRPIEEIIKDFSNRFVKECSDNQWDKEETKRFKDILYAQLLTSYCAGWFKSLEMNNGKK
jgi:hypothetical protein